MSSVKERFLRYIGIDTQSDDRSAVVPSTEGQWRLAYLLADELKELGLTDISVTNRCLVHATLPAVPGFDGPVIGLVAHLDTFPDFNGKEINPKLIKNYDGAEILLNENTGMTLSPSAFPELFQCVGQDLITTDGTSLLGANGKAGIAEIMAALEILAASPDTPHTEIRVVFTPDQEIEPNGISWLEKDLFPVDFALTIDGDAMGEIGFENFNAAHATVSITGRPAFTGHAKGRMINAARIGAEWIAMLPETEIPESTEGYEGFFHIEHFSGSVERAECICMLRDFEPDGLMRRKARLHAITEKINEKYGVPVVALKIQDDYQNMRSALEPEAKLVAALMKTIAEQGVTPKIVPIRGGSDGATLAAMGIPSPNLFTGGENCHGPYEFITVQALEKTAEVLAAIAQRFVQLPADQK